MQLKVMEPKFDRKKIEEILLSENKFITNLISISGLPERDQDEEIDEKEPLKPHTFINTNKPTRATTFQELEERLKTITSKKRLTYKEKLAKKSLKNRIKKKSKQDIRNATLKQQRAAKLNTKQENDQTEVTIKSEKNPETKPVFNSDNKMVFSKIDFANLGKKKIKKQENDPEKLLKKFNDEKAKLQELEQSGETHKLIEIKEKTSWKNALAKAEGQKIKDDPILLKKSVLKKEQKLRSSKKKWEARVKGVEKAKEEKQKKRKENIDKKKKEKKAKKLKSAVKRGKIIPGLV